MHYEARPVSMAHNVRLAEYYTANIFEVIFTVFNCVRISTVISLYGLHFIAAPSTV